MKKLQPNAFVSDHLFSLISVFYVAVIFLILSTLSLCYAQVSDINGPTPDIKANGSDGSITLGTSDILLVTISLTNSLNAESSVDGWVLLESPFGWHYYNVSTTSWVNPDPSHTDISSTFRAPLNDLGPFEVLNMSTSILTEGAYTFYFAIGTKVNGYLDFEKLLFDSVKVYVSSLTGRELLFSREIVAADDTLKAQLNSNPNNQEAHFFRSITRLLRIVEQNQDGTDVTTFKDSLREILDQFGFSRGGRSIIDFSSAPPKGADGHTVLPSNSPTGGDLQEFLRNVVLTEVSRAIDENLVAIDSSFSLVVSIEEMAGLGISEDAPVEIDYGDVKLLESLLNGLKAVILTSLAYDLNMDTDQIYSLGNNLKIQQDIIDPNTSLLKLTPGGTALLAQAKSAIINGINAYIAGSAFIRAETDDQNNDFITIEIEDLQEEANLRAELEKIKNSLSGGSSTVTIMNTFVNINKLFDFPFDLRDLLPPIVFSPERENYIEPGTFPDPTFNGILPGMTQEELADDLDIE